MKRKYFKKSNEFNHLEKSKNCFLKSKKRKARQKTKKSFFTFSNVFSGLHILCIHLKKKYLFYLKNFFFFKFYYFNCLSYYWRTFGEYYYDNFFFYFLGHHIYFNKYADLTTLFKNYTLEDSKDLIDNFNLNSITQLNNKNIITFYKNSSNIKKININMFFNWILFKKKNINKLNFFFFLFILKKYN